MDFSSWGPHLRQCGLERRDWFTQRRKGAKGPSLSGTVALTGGVAAGFLVPGTVQPLVERRKFLGT